MKMMILIASLVMLGSLAVAPSARAQANHTNGQTMDAVENRARYYIDETFYQMQNIMPACFECSPAEAGEATPPASCRDYYSDLYSKPVVDFRFVFGYVDFGQPPIAVDGPMRAMMVDRVMRPCASGEVGMCGFQLASDDDSDVFFKNVKGPDGQMHRVNLTLTNSSAGMSERENRGSLLAAQNANSARAREAFNSGLRSADLVTYVGHARNGGGPDFTFPDRTAAGAVNYTRYLRDKPGANAMLEAIRSSGHPPKAVGLFACNSDNKFAEAVRSASGSRTAVAASEGLIHIDAAFTQGISFLDSHLAMRCGPEMIQAMNATKTVLEGARIAPPSMRGFFESAPQAPGPVPYETLSPQTTKPLTQLPRQEEPQAPPVPEVVPVIRAEPPPELPPTNVPTAGRWTDRISIRPVPDRAKPLEPANSQGGSSQ